MLLAPGIPSGKLAIEDDPPDAIIIRPPTGVGSGTGSFEYLDNAIDTNPSNGSIESLAVRCSLTCVNQEVKAAVWQGFPDGFEPLRLEIKWDAVGGISLATGRTSRADLTVEYDIGNGWEIAQTDAWVNEIPACSEAHPSRCADNVFVKVLDPQQSTGVIKVRATASVQMTACADCGDFDTSHMNVIMSVRNIQVVARGPRLVAEPGYTVTRGDEVTFRVVGAPVTSYSNWRYEFLPAVHSSIVRTQNINTSTWSGALLHSGKARVVVIVPGQLSSIPLQTTPSMTVNPRSWNSLPEPPRPLTGLAPPPGIFSAATNVNGPMGWSNWNLTGTFDAVKLDGDTPNKGLSYVIWVKHEEDLAVWFGYEISPDLEQGTTFYNRQCGQGGFILGSVLRSNTYEHESGTQKGHYQQYRDKLAEPSVNYAKFAEPRWGTVGQTLTEFKNLIYDAFNTRRQMLHNAAQVQACNADVRYNATCTPGNPNPPNQGFGGNINYPPYQLPCK